MAAVRFDCEFRWRSECAEYVMGSRPDGLEHVSRLGCGGRELRRDGMQDNVSDRRRFGRCASRLGRRRVMRRAGRGFGTEQPPGVSEIGRSLQADPQTHGDTTGRKTMGGTAAHRAAVPGV